MAELFFFFASYLSYGYIIAAWMWISGKKYGPLGWAMIWCFWPCVIVAIATHTLSLFDVDEDIDIDDIKTKP